MPQASTIGFGLSSLAGSGNFRHQEKLIRTAIDCGITHFDVAPYYGSGDAEHILGKILLNCRDAITVTTKYGLVPLGAGKGSQLLRATLRPLFRQVRFLKAAASAVVQKKHAPAVTTFQKGQIINSINDSIKKLGRPIDYFLLHDPDPAFASSAEVQAELAEVCLSAKASCTGLTGHATELPLSALQPSIYRIAQLENSLTQPANLAELATRYHEVFTHRAIQGGKAPLEFLLKYHPRFRAIWQRDIGLRVETPEDIAEVLFRLALAENPRGTVLFSTTNPQRLAQIATLATKPLAAGQAQQIKTLFASVYIPQA